MPIDQATIQPVVLVGGQSKRFGRDKLREPIRRGCIVVYLVDHPIAALREVFGNRVANVGQCHETVAARADAVIEDHHPGVGPIGGIVSALQASGGDVFVIAGDLPRITGDVINEILQAAADNDDALAVLAKTDRLEPCVGLYRRAALPLLIERLAGNRRLHDALPSDRVVGVAIDCDLLININTIQALAQVESHS